jgi:hypothetical protein
MFAHILMDVIFTYLLLASKNTQVGANGIQWANGITGKKDCMSFLPKTLFQMNEFWNKFFCNLL